MHKDPPVTPTKFPQSQARLFCMENASLRKSQRGGQQRAKRQHPALGALIFLALSISWCLFTGLILMKRLDLCSCARPRLKSCNSGKTNEKGAITRRNKQTQHFPLSVRTTSELQKPKATRYPRVESNEPTAPLGS